MSEELTESAFHQLVVDTVGRKLGVLGLVESDSSPWRVRFDSATSVVVVSWDVRDGDIAVRFGPAGDPRFDLMLYLRSVGSPLADRIGRSIPESPSDFHATLALIAQAVEGEGRPAVLGSPDVLRKMDGLRWWDLYPGVRE